MPELQRLDAGHGPAVLAFELANRGYFAASISDRGDEFFDRFAEQHSALLAKQEAGIRACYVLVAEDGSVLGRFNLVFAEDGESRQDAESEVERRLMKSGVPRIYKHPINSEYRALAGFTPEEMRRVEKARKETEGELG